MTTKRKTAKLSKLTVILTSLCLSACDALPEIIINPGHAAPRLASQNTPDTATHQQNNQTPNQAPIIHSFSANPNNVILTENDKITFNVIAVDPDGDELSYTWAATKGILSTTQGQFAQWSPLRSDQTLEKGLATIAVIVSDGKTVRVAQHNIEIANAAHPQEARVLDVRPQIIERSEHPEIQQAIDQAIKKLVAPQKSMPPDFPPEEDIQQIPEALRPAPVIPSDEQKLPASMPSEGPNFVPSPPAQEPAHEMPFSPQEPAHEIPSSPQGPTHEIPFSPEPVHEVPFSPQEEPTHEIPSSPEPVHEIPSSPQQPAYEPPPVTISPPNTPSCDFCQTAAQTGQNVTMRVRLTSPDGQPVKASINWGDGSSHQHSTFVPSGSTVTFNKTYTQANTYPVGVAAWVQGTSGGIRSQGTLSQNIAITAPQDNKPHFSSTSLASSVTVPNKIYFSGTAHDDKALSHLTMLVSGPKGNNLTAFSTPISGTSHSLNNYFFDSNNSSYAGVAGNYTVALWIKDSAGQTESRVFNVNVSAPAPSYGYRLQSSSVTTGGGTWGSILRLNASINSSGNVTFTVSKSSGTFTTTSMAYLKVGTYESHGVNHGSGNIPAGGSSRSFSLSMPQQSWPDNVKSYYVRVQNNDGFAWVGPIRVERYVQ